MAWDDALPLPTQTLHQSLVLATRYTLHCFISGGGVSILYFKSIHNYMVDSWAGLVSKLSTSCKIKNGNIGSFGGWGGVSTYTPISMKYRHGCCTKWLPFINSYRTFLSFMHSCNIIFFLCWLLNVAHIYIFYIGTAQKQPLRGPHCTNLNLLDAWIFSLCFQAFKVPSPRITSALSVPEGTPSREEGHLELLDLRIHSKRYSESFICRQ